MGRNKSNKVVKVVKVVKSLKVYQAVTHQAEGSALKQWPLGFNIEFNLSLWLTFEAFWQVRLGSYTDSVFLGKSR